MQVTIDMGEQRNRCTHVCIIMHVVACIRYASWKFKIALASLSQTELLYNHAPTEQIAADIAQLTEERREHKVAAQSGSVPRKLLLKRTVRSAKARRETQESKWKDSTSHPPKVSTPGKEQLSTLVALK